MEVRPSTVYWARIGPVNAQKLASLISSHFSKTFDIASDNGGESWDVYTYEQIKPDDNRQIHYFVKGFLAGLAL